MSLSAVFFSLVGFIQGAILAVISFFSLGLLPERCLMLIIAAYLLTNGAFHQDGLSDTRGLPSPSSHGRHR
jgi:cobalamin synthase